MNVLSYSDSPALQLVFITTSAALRWWWNHGTSRWSGRSSTGGYSHCYCEKWYEICMRYNAVRNFHILIRSLTLIPPDELQFNSSELSKQSLSPSQTHFFFMQSPFGQRTSRTELHGLQDNKSNDLIIAHLGIDYDRVAKLERGRLITERSIWTGNRE